MVNNLLIIGCGLIGSSILIASSKNKIAKNIFSNMRVLASGSIFVDAGVPSDWIGITTLGVGLLNISGVLATVIIINKTGRLTLFASGLAVMCLMCILITILLSFPEFGFPGLKDGDDWCVCASWYARAVEAGKGCPIFLKRTHENTLKILPIETLKKFAIDLS